jgi:hypothetical protein
MESSSYSQLQTLLGILNGNHCVRTKVMSLPLLTVNCHSGNVDQDMPDMTYGTRLVLLCRAILSSSLKLKKCQKKMTRL